MIFNRVTDARLYRGAAGEEVEEIDDDALYQVVTGMYLAQMLSTVEEKSMGLLSLVPKDAQGEPVTDFSQYVVRDQEGNEVKEWYALAAYLQSFGRDGLPQHYASSDGRKDVSHSWNPIQLLKNHNWLTLAALALILVVLAVAVLVIRRVFFRRGRSRHGYRSYRG